jgi:hypothetical protein
MIEHRRHCTPDGCRACCCAIYKHVTPAGVERDQTLLSWLGLCTWVLSKVTGWRHDLKSHAGEDQRQKLAAVRIYKIKIVDCGRRNLKSEIFNLK